MVWSRRVVQSRWCVRMLEDLQEPYGTVIEPLNNNNNMYIYIYIIPLWLKKINDSNQVGVPDVPGYQKTRGSTTASWPLNCKGPSDSMCLPPGLADRLTRRSQYRQHPVLCWHLLAHRTAWTVDLRASHLAIADCWFNSKVNNVWKANRVPRDSRSVR